MIFSTAFLMSIMGLIRPYVEEPAIAELAPLIFRTWLPFSICGYKYYVAFFIQLYFMCVGATILAGWNSLMVTMMVYAIFKLEQLNWKLCEPNVPHFALANRKQTSIETVSQNPKNYTTLVECVETHIRVIKYTAELTELMTSFVLLDFLSVIVVLCTLLFQAERTEFGIQLICYIIGAFDTIAMLWIYYWHANEITLWSDRLSFSLYENDWYRKDERYKKVARIILCCTKDPIKMRMFCLDLNLTSFIGILRAAYSYYTILAQMEQK